EEIDRIEAGETGKPELPFAEGFAAIGVVVSKNVTGDEKENSDEDKAVVDEGIENAQMRGREVKENDEDREQGADAGQRGQRWLTHLSGPRGWSGGRRDLYCRLGFGR